MHYTSTYLEHMMDVRQNVRQMKDVFHGAKLIYDVKPFQKMDLIPAIEVAIGRFAEVRALANEVADLEARLAARKSIDRAKGRLMDEFAMTETEAFSFIQRRAMTSRTSMRQVSEAVVAGTLNP